MNESDFNLSKRSLELFSYSAIFLSIFSSIVCVIGNLSFLTILAPLLSSIPFIFIYFLLKKNFNLKYLWFFFFLSVYISLSVSWFLNAGVVGSTSQLFIMLSLLVSLIVNKNKFFYFILISLYPVILYSIEKIYPTLVEKYPNQLSNEIDMLIGSFVATSFTYVLVIYLKNIVTI